MSIRAIGRAGRSTAALRVSVVVFFGGVSLLLGADRVLFPAPIHITRELTDAVGSRKTIVDEYCHGNRVVAISGRRTSIADYAKGQLTTIDFAAGTYSITSFDELARAGGRTTTPAAAAANADDWRAERRGNGMVGARSGETIEVSRSGDPLGRTIRVTADRQLTLSRAAVEALVGTAYPNRADRGTEVAVGALRAARNGVGTNAAGADEYHLPLEFVERFNVDGEVLESRNVVIRVGNELPPAELIAIPPGATRVEADTVATQRALEELDGGSAAIKP